MFDRVRKEELVMSMKLVDFGARIWCDSCLEMTLLSFPQQSVREGTQPSNFIYGFL